MTETYTTKSPARGIIKRLDKETIRLDVDDQLFYELIKSKMDTILRQPHPGSITKISSYSKAWRTPLT
ncbi:hypothetical protein [Parapedobacter koreensis]|uniref:Uncharacterized protein n=1 Tax=Parapedobacter koreensis TaxID=332977 RepID=A0A1H7SML7_9SPHI|nr:hypothetical protein [Parapedobacter koreensis]SEL73862.1 hypothetical protein SAMN05421740_10979 [Parapedobacter koreensis]